MNTLKHTLVVHNASGASEMTFHSSLEAAQQAFALAWNDPQNLKARIEVGGRVVSQWATRVEDCQPCDATWEAVRS